MAFQTEKLSVTYIPPMTPLGPLEGRIYTLTHSDLTGQLFLSVGYEIDSLKINWEMRDEVVADWRMINGQYVFTACVHISNGDFDVSKAGERYEHFKKMMPVALRGIIQGDQTLLTYYPWLLDSPIYVQFSSVYPEYNKMEYYGMVRHYQS